MTISSTVRIAGPYIGSGAATVFPFAFKVFAAAEMQVAKLNTTSNVEIILVLNTDYTVQLNGDQNGTPGGTITLPAVLASGYNLTITSDIANLQPTDLTNQGGFYPEVITDALDRATIQIQQLDQNSRAIKIPLSDGVLDMTTPVVAERASKYLAFNAAGLPVVSAGTGSDSALRTDLANATAVSAGSRLSGFRQTGTGATARTVDAKLKDTVSVKDFGAVGDGVADDTAAIQAAINSLALPNNPAAGSILWFPSGIYIISSTIYITLDHATITLWGDAKVTLLARVPASNYVIDVDYATGATANFVNFNLYNINITDNQAPYCVRNGLKFKRVIASKFVQCEFINLDIAVNMGEDSNLNTFDTCMWRGNNYGWKSISGNANANTFLNCQWRYHNNTAFDSTGTGGNLIIGGDFEPDNVCPVIIASNIYMWFTRIERNQNGGVWVQVGDNNNLNVPCYANGGTQPAPFMQVIGINNKIIVAGGMCYSIANLESTSSNNEIDVSSPVQSMGSGTIVLLHDKGSKNIMKTNASIQSTTNGSFVEAIVDNLVPADLTLWTATNCTVALISGQKYSITGTGGIATLTYALPVGSYSGLRMAVSVAQLNSSGGIYISLAGGSGNLANCADLSPFANRRVILGTFDYLTPVVYVNPVVLIQLAGTSVGGEGYVWNLRMSANGIVPH